MTQETRRGLRFPVFVGILVLLAAALSAFVFLRYPLLPPAAGSEVGWVLAVLVAAVAVSEALTVLLPGSAAISLSVPLFVAVGVYCGPAAAVLVGLASNVPSFFSRPRIATDKLAFNLGEVVFTTAIPAIVYVELGAPLFAVSGNPFSASMLPAVGLAATLGTLVNLSLGGIAVSILYGESLRAVWKGTIAWMLPSQLALGFVGIAIAQIANTVSIPGLALFVLPLVVARQTYQQSVKLREAYADTISSLVAALETKDVYTKGHSVRVAEYTVQIAEAMGFAAEKVARIQQAALLHDIGKVGVSLRVLSKEARLTDGEYEEIKQHPRIGAHIVGDVPYLADLVPMIEAHHERFDGRGYGSGAAGNAIPLEARILAVADSYDAMTSARPYRGAMTHEAAMRELHENSGSQFDPDAVLAFERSCGEPLGAAIPTLAAEMGTDEV